LTWWGPRFNPSSAHLLRPFAASFSRRFLGDRRMTARGSFAAPTQQRICIIVIADDGAHRP
jgi:hypothetical protein